jgi:hypothetical protein
VTFSTKDGPWAEYAPSKEAPWDPRRVVHLHRRAGFAATWQELQRDLADGPGKSVDRVLAGKTRSAGVPDGFEAVAGLIADGAARAGDPARLKGWWLHRMYAGPDPLGERLTLLWHNHFATGLDKVNDPAAMRRQNELFREHGRGPFARLLTAVVKDPALLVYLDAPANRKGRPGVRGKERETTGKTPSPLTPLPRGERGTGSLPSLPEPLRRWAERTARLVAAAGRLGLWRGSCLERSLVLCCLLSRRGLPAELRIGVRVEAGRLAAHAWVEAGGLVVNDHQGERRCFVPFDRPITPHPEAP